MEDVRVLMRDDEVQPVVVVLDRRRRICAWRCDVDLDAILRERRRRSVGYVYVIAEDDVRALRRFPSEDRGERDVRALGDACSALRQRFFSLVEVHEEVIGRDRLPPVVRRVLGCSMKSGGGSEEKTE